MTNAPGNRRGFSVRLSALPENERLIFKLIFSVSQKTASRDYHYEIAADEDAVAADIIVVDNAAASSLANTTEEPGGSNIVYVVDKLDDTLSGDFIQRPLPVDIKIRVDHRGLEGLGPVSIVFVYSRQQLCCATIPAGKQGLDVCPSGHIGVHPDIRHALQAFPYMFDFRLQDLDVLKGNPLKGRARFRYEGVEAHGDLPDSFLCSAGL